MGRTITVGAAALAASRLVPGAKAQEQVRFDLKLESRGFPDFDANPVIEGEPGRERLFTAEMVISSSGLGEHGIEGWSLGLWNAGVDIVSVTDEGTAIADKSEGGLFDSGFLIYQTIRPLRNGSEEKICAMPTASETAPPGRPASVSPTCASRAGRFWTAMPSLANASGRALMAK